MVRQPGAGRLPPLVLVAVLIFAAAVAAVMWLPRAAAVLAVAGIVLFGLVGVVGGVQWLWDAGSAPVGPWSGYTIGFYGAVPLDGGITALFAGVQGVALLAVGCLLAPRLLTWEADAELAERARALARRVDGLTRTRSDATETAVAELRRIERDLHDGAQARLVAVGMSLRAVEQLMRPTRRRRWRWSPRRARRPPGPSTTCATWCAASTRRCWPTAGSPTRCAPWRSTPCSTSTWTSTCSGEPPMPVAAAVYFAVAEALTNAARHAGACAVRSAWSTPTGCCGRRSPTTGTAAPTPRAAPGWPGWSDGSPRSMASSR